MKPDEDPQAGLGAAAPGATYEVSKSADAGLALPIGGLLLLFPPVITVFASDAPIFGAPAIVAYLFTVWAVLILLAWRLSRSLGVENGRDEGRDGV